MEMDDENEGCMGSTMSLIAAVVIGIVLTFTVVGITVGFIVAAATAV